MSIQNPNVASLAVLPIDGTAAAPSISFGGSSYQSSGTGIYGTFGHIKHSIDGTLAMGIDSSGVTVAGALSAASFATSVNGFSIGNDVYIISGATAPINGTTGDNFAGPGSIYIARDSGAQYQQTGLITNPVWVILEAGAASVLATVLAGYVSGAGTLASTDTVLQGFNKLNGNAAAIKGTADAALPSASFTDAAVSAKLLTGLAAGANTPISATDSILVALANLQAQIDAL